MTKATIHGALIDYHDDLMGLGLGHKVSLGPPGAAEHHLGHLSSVEEHLGHESGERRSLRRHRKCPLALPLPTAVQQRIAPHRRRSVMVQSIRHIK